MKRSLELWVCKKALLAHMEATGQPMVALSAMNDAQITTAKTATAKATKCRSQTKVESLQCAIACGEKYHRLF